MRSPKPFYRAAAKKWYVSINRKQTLLGEGPPHSPPLEVMQKYHALMADRQPTTQTTTVQMLVGRFLTWCETHREPRTYEFYARFLVPFVKHVGPKLTIDKLKPFHVTEWLDSIGGGDTYKNGAVGAIMRAFNWASKQGHILANPVKGVERPQAQRRVVYLSPEQWAAVLAKVKDAEFIDVLRFLRATGCRPQEMRAIEARHFDRANEQIVFPIKESKGKKVSRVIPLNDEALRIIRRLALKYPGKDDRLFRNRRGNPWKAFAITCRFGKLRKKLGFPLFAYAIRHTFITDALMRRVDPATLACIVGHKDATMILKVYGHVNLNKGHVRAALAQATGEAPARKAEIA